MKKSISKIVTLWLALVLCFPVPFYAAFAEGEEKETVVQEPIEQSDAEEQVIGEDKIEGQGDTDEEVLESGDSAETNEPIDTEFTEEVYQAPKLAAEGLIEIRTAEDLDNVRNDLAGNYILMNDIDLSEETAEGGSFYDEKYGGWKPIGFGVKSYYYKNFRTDVNEPFVGTFDGNGNTISGINASSNKALFGENEGKISNVNMKDSSCVLVNQNRGTVSNCNSSCTLDISESYIGGITLINTNTIENCSFSGTIIVPENCLAISIGGIAGNNEGRCSDCKCSGSIQDDTNTIPSVGGIVGKNMKTGSCTDCESTASISISVRKNAYVGGIAGDCDSGIIKNGTHSGAINVVTVVNDSIKNREICIGGIAGKCTGQISGVNQNDGEIICNDDSHEVEIFLGGIAGFYDSKTGIGDSINNGTLKSEGGNSNVGGICGYLSKFSGLKNCVNSKNSVVTTNRGIIGGLAGYSYGVIEDSVNEADISCKAAEGEVIVCGGAVGYLDGATAIINRTTNGGNVSIVGQSYVGGIVGGARSEDSSSNRVLNSENNGDVCIESDNDGAVGGILGRGSVLIQSSYNKGEIMGTGVPIYVGGVAGDIEISLVQECVNEGVVKAEGKTGESSAYVGGLAGRGDNALFYRSYNDNDICINANGKISYASVGGIAGVQYYGNTSTSNMTATSECYNNGDIITLKKTGGTAGGIIGHSKDDAISNCYNRGSITSEGYYVGGVVGYATGEKNAIANVYNIGSIKGNSNIKATVVGCIENGDARGNLIGGEWITDKPIGSLYAAGATVGSNKKYSQMKKQDTFNSFDFAETWRMGTGSNVFPILRNCINPEKQNSLEFETKVAGKKAATHFDAGYTGDVLLVKTGEVIEKGEAIPTLGHKIVKIATKAATCKDVGYKSHFECELCGKMFKDASGTKELTSKEIRKLTIKKKKHSFKKKSDEYLKSAATCTKPAIYYYTCTMCSEKGKKTFKSGKALGHDFVSGSITKATGKKDGKIASKCSRCGKTNKGVKIPKASKIIVLNKKSVAYVGAGGEKDLIKVVVKNSKYPLNENEYDVSYSEPVYKGKKSKGTVTIKFKPECKYYSGSLTLTYKITKVPKK